MVGRILCYLFLVAFIGLTVMLVTATAARSATASPLPSVAQWAGGRPLVINVTPGPGAWGGSASVYYPGIFIGQQAYEDATVGNPIGLFVFLHEIGHTTGITNEHQADCFALTHFKAALGFWGLRHWTIEQRYRTAVRFNTSRVELKGKYGCMR